MILEPWHGPTVVALSEQHGIDAADLPSLALVALAVASLQATARNARPTLGRERRAGVAAIVLGTLLLAGLLFPRIGSPLVPAAGGTFAGGKQQVAGRNAEPVDRWTHLAVTYDGATLRLFIDGVEASSRSASGSVLRTTDPLWVGGNRPYGEYFAGVIDEVRVFGRALGPSEIRAAMMAPIASRSGHAAPGLVAAYPLDGGGRRATDASGNGNTGTIRRATWTNEGRFGPGLRFDGTGAVVRVPASTSLNLRSAMTLMAWVKPSESQSGWRTVVARQTDAYFLMAGGGLEAVHRLETIDQLRFALLILLAAVTGVALVRNRHSWASGRRRWYWPIALFIAGSVVDAAFAPSDTLVGPTLVAIWCGATAAHRDEWVSMFALAAAFALATILAIAVPAALPLPDDNGGVVRAAALGLLLLTAGAPRARRARKPRPPRSVGRV